MINKKIKNVLIILFLIFFLIINLYILYKNLRENTKEEYINISYDDNSGSKLKNEIENLSQKYSDIGKFSEKLIIDKERRDKVISDELPLYYLNANKEINMDRFSKLTGYVTEVLKDNAYYTENDPYLPEKKNNIPEYLSKYTSVTELKDNNIDQKDKIDRYTFQEKLRKSVEDPCRGFANRNECIKDNINYDQGFPMCSTNPERAMEGATNSRRDRNRQRIRQQRRLQQ